MVRIQSLIQEPMVMFKCGTTWIAVWLVLGGLSAETSGQERKPAERRLLADSVDRPVDSAARWIPDLPRMHVDDARAAAAGIRKVSGERLTLYTDMPPEKEIDQLPELFDQAFSQWCAYFDVDPAKHSDWRMTAFLIKDKTRFQRTGLLPEDLSSFKNGFSRNYELWLYDQPSDYYGRHLLLHEGTHGFMNTILSACGPPWYMEGIAEMLATHRWLDGRLTLGHIPESCEEVVRWGRIEMIQKAIAARRGKRLGEVIEYSARAHLEVEPYAWCWAAATLLDRHPRYQQRFRQLHRNVSKPHFTERFYRMIGNDWDELCEEWQLFVTGLEYGHDIPGTVLDFTPGKPLPPSGAEVTVVARGSWQNSGLRLTGGVRYRLRAAGRYQVADKPKTWWCEPNGVSIRYYQGRPLGILLAAVRPDEPKGRGEEGGVRERRAKREEGGGVKKRSLFTFRSSLFASKEGSCALLRPLVVGLGTTLSPKQPGTLYLKINDSAAELSDNAGELKVQIKPG